MDDMMQPPSPKESQQRHPIHTIQDILNNTPPDMIEHEYKQGSDGSIEIKIKIPGRAEQAKQRAMQQAEQAMQQAGVAGNVPQQGSAQPGQSAQPQEAKPSANVSQMPQQGEDKAVAARSNVVVKVAMTTQDVGNNLKSRYPESFLKKMGLL
jgi:hypothetical protein